MQFLPLIHQDHALSVDQPEAVDPPLANVEPVLDVGGLVHGGRVTEGGRLVQRTRGRRLERYEVVEVVDFRQRIRRRVRVNLDEDRLQSNPRGQFHESNVYSKIHHGGISQHLNRNFSSCFFG